MNANEIHLWTTFLSASADEFAHLYHTLSADERKRAQAFRFERHRTFFAIGRGLLRSILGWYLGCAARDIVFKYGPRGKPALDNCKPTLHFNLAHSEDYVVYALSGGTELGIDVEAVRPMPDIESIARSFFSPGECVDLFNLPTDKRLEAFFNCWTRKEAYVKAIGGGLSAPLDRFQVSLVPGQPAVFLKLLDRRYPISSWSLFHLLPSQGYVGALAIPLRSASLSWRNFRDASECLAHIHETPAEDYSFCHQKSL